MKNNDHIIYGLRPIIEALKSGQSIEKLFLQTGIKGELSQELLRLCKNLHLSPQHVPVERLNRICPKNHQGAIAYTSAVEYADLETLLETMDISHRPPMILICDRVTDVRNFGAIARTAECAGVNAIIIPLHNSAAINEDAVKTSAGAIHHLPICKVENLKTAIHLLKAYGFQVLGVTEKGKTVYTEADLTRPTVLILGSEEDGISNEYLKLCDQQLYIPMLGEIASLNVSVANGILLFEGVRQRNLNLSTKVSAH